MPVAALYDSDLKWYRGQIVHIHPESSELDVLFVDFGNTEKMQFKNVRYLKHEFFYDDISVRAAILNFQKQNLLPIKLIFVYLDN